MKRFTFLLAFLSLCCNYAKSQVFVTKSNSDSDNSVTITSCSDYDSELIIPKEINGSTVTKIYSGIIQNDDRTVNKLYIPNDINQCKVIAYEPHNLSCIVLDNNITLDTYLIRAKDATLDNYKLNNVFTLYEIETINLIGGSSFFYSNLQHLGIATVSNKVNNNTLAIHVYNWVTEKTFNDDRYENLIWAITQYANNRGYSINDICKIDLSDLSKNKGNISFQNNPLDLLGEGATVIIDANTSYSSIKDKADFAAPSSELRGTISYSRASTSGWNTVCLPFAITKNDFPEGTFIYTISNGNHDELNLAQVDGVGAGEPCFIYTDAERWDLTLSERTIPAGITPQTTTVDNTWKMIGSFTNRTIGEGHFKLNSAGDTLGRTNSPTAVTYPFRCYLDYIGTASAAPERVRVGIDEEETITLIPDDGEPQQVRLYDLMGRPAKEDGEVILRHDNIIIR